MSSREDERARGDERLGDKSGEHNAVGISLLLLLLLLGAFPRNSIRANYPPVRSSSSPLDLITKARQTVRYSSPSIPSSKGRRRKFEESPSPLRFRDARLRFLFIFLITAELKMDVLREREVKDSLERQLQDEQKVRGEYIYIYIDRYRIRLSAELHRSRMPFVPERTRFTTNLSAATLPVLLREQEREISGERASKRTSSHLSSAINQSGREETRGYKVSRRILLFEPRRTLC